MTVPYTVCAYYTEGDYEDVVKPLRESLEHLGIKHYLKKYPSRGLWIENCAMKPEFILHCLERFEKILYVDADAIFDREPEDIFTGDMHYYKFRGEEPLSGTLYFNRKAIPFIEAWVELQKEHTRVFDQEVMATLIPKFQSQMSIKPLPDKYIKIFDLMRRVVNPVITHYQASRKYRKNKVKERIMTIGFVLPSKVRILADGTFYLVRRDKAIEEYMDSNLTRYPNERKWYPDVKDTDLDLLRDIFKGQTANIIGKGPSLDNLTAKDIVDGPIIALNEAIHKVESLDLPNSTIVVQQDAHLEGKCIPSKDKTKMFISAMAGQCGKGFANRVVYKAVSLGLRDASLSAQIAIGLCKVFGITKIRMVCFDACVNKKTAYAECVGSKPEEHGKPERFLRHRKILDADLRRYSPEWVIPVNTPSSDDKPQQS